MSPVAIALIGQRLDGLTEQITNTPTVDPTEVQTLRDQVAGLSGQLAATPTVNPEDLDAVRQQIDCAHRNDGRGTLG